MFILKSGVKVWKKEDQSDITTFKGEGELNFPPERVKVMEFSLFYEKLQDLIFYTPFKWESLACETQC